MTPDLIEQGVLFAEGVSRNDPCWCGSMQKYKKCHGRAREAAGLLPGALYGDVPLTKLAWSPAWSSAKYAHYHYSASAGYSYASGVLS
jgi:uncharacterized protein YecA (UPF0149 family)